MINNINFIFPEILISIFLMMLLILGVFKKNSSSLIYNLSISSLVVILVLVLTFPQGTTVKLFSNGYIIDDLSIYMKSITIISGIFVMLTSSKYLKIIKIYQIEYPILLLSSILGMIIMISSNDLIVFIWA